MTPADEARNARPSIGAHVNAAAVSAYLPIPILTGHSPPWTTGRPLTHEDTDPGPQDDEPDEKPALAAAHNAALTALDASLLAEKPNATPAQLAAAAAAHRTAATAYRTAAGRDKSQASIHERTATIHDSTASQYATMASAAEYGESLLGPQDRANRAANEAKAAAEANPTAANYRAAAEAHRTAAKEWRKAGQPGLGTTSEFAAQLADINADEAAAREAGRATESEDYPEVPAPDIPQPGDYECGACQAMTVGKLRGVGPATLSGWVKLLETTVEYSTNPMKIVQVLQALAHVHARHGMTLTDLQEYTRAGWYVIVPVQDYGKRVDAKAKFPYGHYLGVTKVDTDFVVCQDSTEDNITRGSESVQAPGRILIRHAEFLKSWHDIDQYGNKYIQFGIAVGPPL